MGTCSAHVCGEVENHRCSRRHGGAIHNCDCISSLWRRSPLGSSWSFSPDLPDIPRVGGPGPTEPHGPSPTCEDPISLGPVCVTLVFSTRGQRYVRVGLCVPLLGSLVCLRRTVADEGTHLSRPEIYSTGSSGRSSTRDDLTCIADNDVIYAFQAPPLYIRAGASRISGYHHSLPSSPFSSGPEGQRLPPSGTLSSEFLNQGGPARILLLVCNTSQAVR
ncbi:unnamed protein product [Merluccius merluccius]